MRLSITVSEESFRSLDEMFATLGKYGYGAIDYTGRDLGRLSAREESDYCSRLKSAAENHGLFIGQTHAPFLINRPESEFLGKDYRDSVIAAIERTARLGAKYVVIHPYCPQGLDFFINARTYDYAKLIDHNKEVNLECFSAFVPVLRREGLVMCIENLFAYDVLLQRHVPSSCSDADETNFYIDALGEDFFGACYDSGHLNHFGGDETAYIEKLGKRLKAVHLNDSWGKDFYGMDWHLMPGQGDVSWEKIASALEKIGYAGTANFEIGPRAGLWFIPQLKYISEVGNLIFNNEKKE